MKVVALVATYNERHCVANCIRSFVSQGVEVVLFDNESTDGTYEIAASYLGNGVREIRRLPRSGTFNLRAQLEAKANWARNSDVDWVVHADADEIRLSNVEGEPLAATLTRLAASGANAANFREFTFVPTREEPVHYSETYLDTMDRYYHMAPSAACHIKAWMPQALPDFDLVTSGGHLLSATGLRLAEESLQLRHYIFLSLDHAKRKYLSRYYPDDELAVGWHNPRQKLQSTGFVLPAQEKLKRVEGHVLDSSDSVTGHLVFGHS